MPKVCCRCNASGRCTNCSCKKSNRKCVNCLPFRQGHCNNPRTRATTTPLLGQPLENQDQSQTDSGDGESRPMSVQTSSPNFTPRHFDTSPVLKIQPPTVMTDDSTSTMENSASVFTTPINYEATSSENSSQTDQLGPPPLPEYTPAPHPTFTWGDKDGKTFTNAIQQCYDEVVHWKKKPFKIPTGKVGKTFVLELTRLFRAFADSSALESVALKAAMVMPVLLIQKPHQRSRPREHAKHLERRLKLWSEGDLDALMDEGHTIQTKLKHHQGPQNTNNKQTARSFAKLVMEGKMRAALRLLSQDNNGVPLPLDSQVETNRTHKSVREVLQEKHPCQQDAKSAALIDQNTRQPTDEPHPILFEKIDGQLIRSMALRTDGSAGPSGMDAAAWKRLCTSFKTASTEFCDALAATARKLCSHYVDPSGISAFVACHLIALDKCPGVRPIGVGETARRIIGRTIAKAISDDIQ